MYAKTTLTVVLALLTSTAFAGDPAAVGGETGAVPSFTTLDANSDGSISKEEAASSSTVLSKWDSLDADQDGSLSSTEFANVTGSSTMDEDTSSTTDDSSDSSDDDSKY